MNIIKNDSVKDCVTIEIVRHVDERGFLEELYSPSRYEFSKFKQLNCCLSEKHVIRGIHRTPYSKTVTCIKGKIFDIAVDLREDSPTYLNWHGEWLTEENKKQLFVPEGCGHAFYAAGDENLVVYWQGGVFDSKVDKSFNWKDPSIKIQWPESDTYILSCLLYTSPSPRDRTRSRMPSSA